VSSSRRLLDDCFLHDKDRLRHDDAIALLRARLVAVAESEEIDLGAALNRVLAEPVIAPRHVPLTDNSAVDGYAFSHAAYTRLDGHFLVGGRIAAGHPADTPLGPDEAARIFTGAVMPAGADSVAMQEDCVATEKDGVAQVRIPAGLKPGANRRRAGEDVAAGAVVLEAGARLRPQDIAAIASLGFARIPVREKLRVALLSNGDEIVRPGAAIEPGQVYDSNHYLIAGLLQTTGAEITDLGVLPDNASSIRAALQAAAQSHHVILSTGGASRGEEDHIIPILDAIGTRHMWQIAVKPGRPMTMGQIGQTVFAGLPGNPVAAMVCFLLYVRPMLFRLGGAAWPEPVRYPLPARFSVARKKPDRREFVRGILATDANGALGVEKFSRDGSGLISGLREADGLIEIAEDVTSLAEGDAVSFIPFSEFGIASKT